MRKTLLPLILLISLILGASSLTRGHQWGDDFAWYILQAKSIWNGSTDKFMEQSAFTNYQSTTYLGPLAYPWGYPLILVPAYALKGISPLALKLPALFFYIGFLVCLYLFVRNRLSEPESLLLVSLFAFNPLLLQFLDQILSDIPFLFFSTLSLLLITWPRKRTILQYALIGASIFFTAFLRATGILLLGCFLLVEFFDLVNSRNNQIRLMAIIRDSFIVCFVFALLWALNVVLFPSGGQSYFSQYAGASLESIKGFTIGYFYAFGTFFGEAIGGRLIYYLVLIFFLIGAWQRRKQDALFLLFFIFWMIVHITYPYWQGPRYIFPLLPIFIYLAFQGMKYTIDKLAEQFHEISRGASYGLWSLIAIAFLYTSSANAYANLRNDRAINGPFDAYSMEIYDYIKRKTPPESVVVFFKPRVMVMMTEHSTIMSTECNRMFRGDYLVLSRKVGENQQITPEKIGDCNLPLNEVLKNSRFIVYQIQK